MLIKEIEQTSIHQHGIITLSSVSETVADLLLYY